MLRPMSATTPPAPPHPGRTESALRWISLTATGLALFAGLMALIGWWTGQDALNRLHAGWPPLLPANALGLVLAAAALLL